MMKSLVGPAPEAQRSELPLTRMIIVFADDQTVAVLPDIVSVRRECEGVDVEDGVYRFFDELGRRLVPRFVTPVERRSLLFGATESVRGGDFELELDSQDQGPAFEASLANVVAIEPNPKFSTIADLVRHVAENRRREKRRLGWAITVPTPEFTSAGPTPFPANARKRERS